MNSYLEWKKLWGRGSESFLVEGWFCDKIVIRENKTKKRHLSSVSVFFQSVFTERNIRIAGVFLEVYLRHTRLKLKNNIFDCAVLFCWFLTAAYLKFNLDIIVLWSF